MSDGPGEYELLGIVSHMGSNTACGHYVCHLKKAQGWVIYNDRKVRRRAARGPTSSLWHTSSHGRSYALARQVALSETPPLSLGYMYIYKRAVQ